MKYLFFAFFITLFSCKESCLTCTYKQMVYQKPPITIVEQICPENYQYQYIQNQRKANNSNIVILGDAFGTQAICE